MANLENVGEILLTLVLIGFLTETVVELLKTYIIKTKYSAFYIYTLSIIIGILLSFALQVSLFKPENILAYYIGIVICGLVASRGSNYVHNFLDQLPKKK